MSGEAKTLSELCREALELRGKATQGEWIADFVAPFGMGGAVCRSGSIRLQSWDDEIFRQPARWQKKNGDQPFHNASFSVFAANHIKQIAERCLELEKDLELVRDSHKRQGELNTKAWAENQKLREALEKAKEMNDHLFDVKKKPVNWGSTFVDWGIINQSMLAVDRALKGGQ